MKNNFHIKNVLKKLSRHSRSLKGPHIMHPRREWGIGIFFSVVILISAASLGAYTYFKNQSIDAAATMSTDNDMVYRASLVEEVLNTMEEREKVINDPARQVVIEVTPEPEVATSSPEEVPETVLDGPPALNIE